MGLCCKIMPAPNPSCTLIKGNFGKKKVWSLSIPITKGKYQAGFSPTKICPHSKLIKSTSCYLSFAK